MAARRVAYRMTPARRAALRKAQLASARKRQSRASRVQSHVVRHKKKYATGAVIAGAAAGAAYGTHRYNNVYLYHNTDRRHVASIKKNGLKGVQKGSFSHVHFNEPVGRVFVTKDFNRAKMFGNTVVRVKMNRKEFNRVAKHDKNMLEITKRAYHIHESHLAGKKMKIRRGGPVQHFQYKMMFPDGTKESYGTRQRRSNKRQRVKQKSKAHQQQFKRRSR